MTKGYTTSEFWQSVFVQILALVGMFHIALPTNTPNYVSVAALIVSGITSAWYTHSRQQVKVASINSAPPAQTTLIMRPTTTVNPSDATTQTSATVVPSTQTPNPFVPETNVATPVSTSSDAAKASV